MRTITALLPSLIALARTQTAAAGAADKTDREVMDRENVAVEPRFVAAKVTTPVQSGAVSIEGLFLGPQNILDLKHRLASREGIPSIWIDAALVAALPPLEF